MDLLSYLILFFNINDIVKDAIFLGLSAGLGWTIGAAYMHGVVTGTKVISVITGILWLVFLSFCGYNLN